MPPVDSSVPWLKLRARGGVFDDGIKCSDSLFAEVSPADSSVSWHELGAREGASNDGIKCSDSLFAEVDLFHAH